MGVKKGYTEYTKGGWCEKKKQKRNVVEEKNEIDWVGGRTYIRSITLVSSLSFDTQDYKLDIYFQTS